MPTRKRLLALLLTFAAAGTNAHADNTLKDAILSGRPLADLRLRYESVDLATKPAEAEAVTLRARLGYQIGQFAGFSVLGEFDFVQHLEIGRAHV